GIRIRVGEIISAARIACQSRRAQAQPRIEKRSQDEHAPQAPFETPTRQGHTHLVHFVTPASCGGRFRPTWSSGSRCHANSGSALGFARETAYPAREPGGFLKVNVSID